MNAANDDQQSRQLTLAELAQYVKLIREGQRWSQEQLAAISSLSVRTIQRVEQGLSAGFDTRRAIARAFGFEDIDVFNKPYVIPSEDEIKAARERFDQEHVTLNASPLNSGRELAKLAESCVMDISEPAFELSQESAVEFAELVDYLRDYRDCADAYSETQKLEVYDEMQSRVDALKQHGVSLRYAERDMELKWGSDPAAEPMSVRGLYVIGFPLGEEPDQFVVPKSAGIKV